MNDRGLTGIVLAGGLSSRMGRDKALLMDGVRTFAEAAVDALSGVCREVVICSNARNAASLARLGVARVVLDESPGMGPLSGVVTGLRQARGADCLITACDMPELTCAELADLVASWPADASVAALRLDGDRVRPLPLLCRGSMLIPAQEVLEKAGQAERSLRALLTDSRAVLLDVSGERWRRALLSVDTPEDYTGLALRRAQTCLN
jgi:molybdopterin-guanine dinucleotide biosynthesis protein A